MQMATSSVGGTPSSSVPVSPRYIYSRPVLPNEGRGTSRGATPLTPFMSHTTSIQRAFHPDASLVLVGIRGSGKRSLGLIAATALGRRFITEDHFFQSTTGLTRQDYLKVHGSEEFHKQDIEITRRMLDENKFKCVIDCGLGSMTSTTQDYLRQYSQSNPVIYLLRDMEQIKTLLNLGDRSAKLLQSGDPSHRKCSNFEFYNLQESSSKSQRDHDSADRTSPTYSFKLRQAQADFSNFVRFITGFDSEPSNPPSPFSLDVPIELQSYTHALEIKLSAFEDQVDFASLESGGDVVEVIVDRWHSLAAKTISKLIATVRRYLKSPIILTVRDTNLSTDLCVVALNHGLRLGVEYLSVDLDLDPRKLAGILIARGYTKVIGTFRAKTFTELGWKDPSLVEKVKKATLLQCDILRILLPGSSADQLSALHWFVEEIRMKHTISIPIIAYNTGLLGRTSQILNSFLTSVNHENLMTVKDGKWDPMTPALTSAVALRALFSSYMLDPLKFYIVGGNVSASLSPAMHNAAYALLGLNHSYSTRNVNSWAEIEELGKDDHFGGASVVQPWKVKVVQRLASLSHHAKAIGAVNTLMPLRADSKGSVLSLQAQARNRNRAGKVAAWYGENTDYIGIMVCLNRSLSPRNVIQPKTTGLVIGAGGMARAAVYAMLQMGCKNVFVYNRTTANTRALAQHFNNIVVAHNNSTQSSILEYVRVLESLQDPWPTGFMMPTMIVSCVTHEVLDGNPGADFQVPPQWLESPSGGAVVEMAYMTKETVIIKQIKEFRSASGLPWVVVDGIETLIEQAIAQFEIMTGRRAPRRCMTTAIRKTLRETRQYVADGEEYDA